MVFAAAVTAVAIAAGGCVDSVTIDGRPCPCTSSYQCCAGRCVSRASSCSSAPDADAAGAAPAMTDAAGEDLVDVGSSIDLDGGGDAAADVREAAEDRGEVEDVAQDVTDGSAEADAGDGAFFDAAEAEAATPTPTPTWQSLDGLPDDLVATFELRLGSDGSLYLGQSRLMPGAGRSRTISVFHHDGVGWTKLGGDLPGPPFPLSFALGPDDRPYVIAADGTVQMFQQQAWTALPALPDGLSLSFLSTAIELDPTGRLHAVAQENTTRNIRVVRRSGNGWELLGQATTLGVGRLSPMLAFDRSGPLVALTEVDTSHTLVFRFGAADWELIPGDIFSPAAGGVLAVAMDGTAYAAAGTQGSVVVQRSNKVPWQMLEGIATPYNVAVVTPSIDLASDGTLYVGYLGDWEPGADIVPGPVVSRLDGNTWTALPLAGLDQSVVDAVKMRVGRGGGRPSVYFAYLRNNRLSVKRLP
jgi:hypothetical protein